VADDCVHRIQRRLHSELVRVASAMTIPSFANARRPARFHARSRKTLHILSDTEIRIVLDSLGSCRPPSHALGSGAVWP
jgi:hypothetical protein